MNKRHAIITYPFETILNIKEEFLPYIKLCLLVIPKTDDIGKTYGLANIYSTGFYPEIDSNFSILSFKKISKESAPEKYKLCFNISLYVETDTDKPDTEWFYGNSVDLIIIMYYINNRGQYESRKYKI